MRALYLEPEILKLGLADRMIEKNVIGVYVDCPRQVDLLHTLVAARDTNQPFEVIFARLGLEFGRDVFDAAGPSLHMLVTPTTGLSHIDQDEAKRRNIRIISLKGETIFLQNITSTAEHAWALLLALLRHVPSANKDVLQGRWDRVPHLGTELYGKTLGILGLGRLGTLVASYGYAFMMRVIACDCQVEPFARSENAHVVRRTFDEVMAMADVVSIHLPLETDTKGIIDERRLKLMKPTAVLINTARGELIDEDALLNALQEGVIAGAGLDVLVGDAVWDGRIPLNHPLVSYATEHRNLLLSPHLGGFTSEAIIRTRVFIVDRFIEDLQKSCAS